MIYATHDVLCCADQPLNFTFSDYTENKLYWVDGRLNHLGKSNLDGSSREELLENLQHPYSLVVYGDAIYWTEWESLSVKTMDKTAEVVQQVTSQVSSKPSAIQVRLIGLCLFSTRSSLYQRFFETPEVGNIGIFELLKHENELEQVTSDVRFNSVSN